VGSIVTDPQVHEHSVTNGVLMTFHQFVKTLDAWGNQNIPFFFMVDFEQKKPLAFKLEDLPGDVFYDFNDRTNRPQGKKLNQIDLKINPITEEEFKKKFDLVERHLSLGDSYLTNLTVRNEIGLSNALPELFDSAEAKYKLLYKNEFLVFSPETFIQIKEGIVYSFPMKGTIDAAITNAEKEILADQKELTEHVTIVDLIRNDLSLIAEGVQVTRFRYIDKILSNQKQLLQVSSEISGSLLPGIQRSFGTILEKLLPAGSISGAPKKTTVEIIQQAEQLDRGYYTGVAGIFDGNFFDAGVLIRFIENDNGHFYYRSGGGITTASEWRKEYREVLDKIYVPVNRND
jgi:para-aminobenzoate synthetase component 1